MLVLILFDNIIRAHFMDEQLCDDKILHNWVKTLAEDVELNRKSISDIVAMLDACFRSINTIADKLQTISETVDLLETEATTTSHQRY